MFSNSALDNFVCPIPICQPEAALDSVLNIFQSSNSRSLAVPLENGNWGIIYAEDILSLMSKSWLKSQLALVSYPKSGFYQTNIPQIDVRYFDDSIVPAIVYLADTQLQEFLDCISHNSLFDHRTEYLIVDLGGKLRGRLDRHKILKHLAVEAKRSSTNAGKTKLLSKVKGSVPSKQTRSSASTSPTNKSVSELLASFSHQLKSPLTGIVGLASLLGAKQIGKLNQRQVQYMNLIHHSSKNMMKTVNHILKLVSLTTERRSPKLVNLELLCGQVYQQALTEARAVKEDFQVEALEPELTVVGNKNVVVDREILSRILFHLMLEIYEIDKSWQGLQFKISNSHSSSIAIEISQDSCENNATDFTPETILSGTQSSLNLAIARYLAETIDGSIESFYSTYYCQFKIQLFTPARSSQLSGGEADDAEPLPVAPQDLYACGIPIQVPAPKEPNIVKRRTNQGREENLLLTSSQSGLTSCPLGFSCLKEVCGLTEDNCEPTPCPQERCSACAVSIGQLANGSLEKANFEAKKAQKSLTILYLYPELEAIAPHTGDRACEWDLPSCLSQENWQLDRYRIIEADSLEQAHTLARIWQLDVIILDGYQIANPTSYLRSLLESEYLSNLPLITLDAKTTEAGNQLQNLNIYPCLLPSQNRQIEDLFQVIEIATES